MCADGAGAGRGGGGGGGGGGTERKIARTTEGARVIESVLPFAVTFTDGDAHGGHENGDSSASIASATGIGSGLVLVGRLREFRDSPKISISSSSSRSRLWSAFSNCLKRSSSAASSELVIVFK